MAEAAWLIPLLPILAYVFISLIGHTVKGQGDRVGLIATGVAFIMSIIVLVEVAGGAVVNKSFIWAFPGTLSITMGFQVDGLSATMLVVVTLISLLVHIYSLGYMKGDRRYKRYYGILNLFTGSMLALVLAPNLLMLFAFWELIGLCSFLLIGHWYEKEEVGFAAIKAFMTTRIGDIAMLIGILIVFFQVRSFEFAAIAEAIQSGQFSGAMLTAAAILLFGGAVGKSAQFPLHTWLPDAMAGPTSVSALIHAATLVAAGVYLVARGFDIFSASTTAMHTIAWIGGFTALFAATIALVMEDIKKVLAYSTVSQLGFMMVALGVGSVTAAIFHLVTHAVFKALLFLASGSVIHGAGTQNMHEMGGLRSKMPITFVTWLIGSAALAGVYPLAGFWSKDEILMNAFDGGFKLLYWILVIAAMMTAFYITRATMLTFFGKPRRADLYKAAKESPLTMTGPLVLLGALAVVIGFMNAPATDFWFSKLVFFRQPHVVPHYDSVVFWATASWIVGGGMAFLIYGLGVISRQTIIENMKPLWVVLKNKYYVDEFYNGVFVKGTIALSAFISWFDNVIIDGFVNFVGWGSAKLSDVVHDFDDDVIDGAVNGIAKLFRSGGAVFRKLQTGYVQSYVLAVFFTVVVGLLIFAVGGF